MDRNLTEARFSVASRKFSTNPLPKAVKKAFNLIINRMKGVYENSYFYSY